MMSALDEKVVLELRGLMGDDFIVVYDVFVRSADQAMEELSLAIQAHDLKSVETIAHTLKGSSANIGAKKLSQACELLLEDARNSIVDYFEKYHISIVSEYKSVKESIQEL